MAVEVLQERMTDLADQVAKTSSQMNQMMQMMQTVIAQQHRGRGQVEIIDFPTEN